MEEFEIIEDFQQYREYMDDIPGREDGWKLEYDGDIEDTFLPGSSLRVYKKMEEYEGVLTTFTEATLPGIRADLLYEMIFDINTRKEWDDSYQKVNVLEKLSSNEDIVYKEITMPFPLTNRDYVQWRYKLCNKTDPELIKLYNLYDLKTRYYAISIKSVLREDSPQKGSLVRANIMKYYWLIREDPTDPESCKIKVVSQQDLGGMIPRFVLNKISVSYTKTLFQKFLKSYKKHFF